MINYINKGVWLQQEIANQGHSLFKLDNLWIMSDEVAVQEIIDTFDPLPYAQAEAETKVKAASATKRLEFVTQAAGKDAEYTFKAAEAKQYDIDTTVGIFMQARATATGETPAAIAAEWNAKSLGWQAIGASIAALEDKANQDIKAEANWQNCNVIAEAAITAIEAI